MFRALTLTDLDPVQGSVTLALDPKGHATITGATATGKTVASECLAAAFTGRVPPIHPGAERGGFEVSTSKMQVRIGTTRKGTGSWSYRAVGAEDWIRVSSYAELLKVGIPALAPAADPELAGCIISPRALEDLYATDRTAFRAMLLRALPPVDLRDRVIAAVPGLTLADLVADTGGKTSRPVPPEHPDYPEALVATLLRRQTADNAAKNQAVGVANRESAALAKLRAAPVDAVDEVAITAAQATVGLDAVWTAYDHALARYETDAAAHTASEAKRTTWAADRAAIVKPADVSGNLLVAGRALTEARTALREAEEAERNAAEQERIRVAREDATAAAEAETARKVAEAEERGRQQAASTPTAPPPVAPGKRPGPKAPPEPVAPLFTPAAHEPKRCPTCNQTLPESTDDLPF